MKKIFFSLLLLVSINAFCQNTMPAKTILVNEQRMETRINELAKFGKNDQGKGYRVAFTKGDIEGRTWFIGLMKKAGLVVTIDYAGNIIGKRKGKNPALKPIAIGSRYILRRCWSLARQVCVQRHQESECLRPDLHR